MYLTVRRVLADLACCFMTVTMDDWMAFSLLCVPLREGCVSARRMVCSVRPFAYGRAPLAPNRLLGTGLRVWSEWWAGGGPVCPCEPEIGERENRISAVGGLRCFWVAFALIWRLECSFWDSGGGLLLSTDCFSNSRVFQSL
jgi:hypothetical protein